MNYNYTILNRQPRLAIPTGDLRVAPYEIEQLLEVEIRQKLNEHSTLYLKGLLSDKQKESYAESSTKGTNVSLSVVDASVAGKEYILFQGVVKDLAIQVVGETRYIEVQAVSYSYLLDIEKKSRSFQNKKITYTDLITQITDSYPGAAVIDNTSGGVATGKFIMQHLETDWEFLQRLASHFNTGLIGDVRFDAPKYFFGPPKGQSLKLDNTNYLVKQDLEQFHQLSENGVKGLKEDDFICYEVVTNYLVRVGDAVSFQGKQLYVAEITGQAQKGVFTSTLILRPKKGLSQLYRPNQNVAGASFNGRILESKNDRVKVSLDIDRSHNPGEPCFFPYSTIYSSTDGSGWYCMPETGDTVRLYFPDGEDDHAYAISSVHEQVDQALTPQNQESGKALSDKGSGVVSASGGAGAYSGLRDDPGVKSLTYGSKEIRLTAEGVYIITDNAMITLTEEGVAITCENDIAFKSAKNIVLCAEENVNMVGTSGVDITCGETSGVMLKENVQVIGQEVKAN